MADPLWGPHNPHPLSKMSTELIWEGKYDEYGNRREVDIAGAAFPMQRIETIDQPRSEAAAIGQLAMFEKKSKRLDDFRNRLIWGDNKLVMASLLKEFKGQLDLIYIDPPFDVGADFTMDVPIGDERETIGKDQSTLEMVAYNDTWGKGTDSYLQMMHDRLCLMKDLLADDGSIYVHLDEHVSHAVKLILDDVFGGHFQNEIVVRSTFSHADAGRFGSVHQVVLFYTKTETHKYKPIYLPYEDDYIEKYYRYKDQDGRRWLSCSLTGAGSSAGQLKWRGMSAPPGRHWSNSVETLEQWDKEGRIYWTRNGVPRLKQYLDEMEGMPASDVWWDKDCQPLLTWTEESVNYATQKPEALLDRIIRASTEEGDIVADLFCGSGTTGAVAERLGRRWIMSDLGRFAVHTSRKRLIDLQRKLHNEERHYRAFDLYNLGRYERQWWQRDALKGADTEHRRVVLEFFRAEILTTPPSPLLHGRKAGSFCHVDGIDSIFSREEARELARAVVHAGGTECFCLAWEFEMDLRLTTAAIEQEYGIRLKLIQIPREIMEKNRKGPPPFLEMAVLEAEPVYRGKGSARKVDIKLTKFLPSLAEVPTKELEALQKRAIKSGFDFIDFWAVDFEWHPEKPFAHHWQDYRTKQDRSLKTISDAGHVYERAGNYTVCVKVVDVFGSDTSITVEVKA